MLFQKLYGYDPTKSEYEVHRITTESPTTSPSIICITALPSDIEMSLPYTPTPFYTIDDPKLTTVSPIIETPSTIFEPAEITTISSTIPPIIMSTTSSVQTTVPVIATTIEDQISTTTNPTIMAASTVQVTSTSIPSLTQSLTTTDIPITTVIYDTFTSDVPTNTDSVQTNLPTPIDREIQIEEKQNISTTPSYSDTVVEVTKTDSTVPLQIKLKNQEFSKELDDPESDKYKELSDGFKETVSEYFVFKLGLLYKSRKLKELKKVASYLFIKLAQKT